jgi:hypothetical protein
VITLLVAGLYSERSAQALSPYQDPNVAEGVLPQVPGCSWYWNEGTNFWENWCGSDEMGWYNPVDWYILTGINYQDYRLYGVTA